MAIITLQDLKSYSGIADMDDNKAQAVVDGVNQWVEDYTGRIFGEIKDVTDVFDYAPTVFLSHVDIQEITSVKVYGEDVTTETLCNRTTGRVVIRKYGGFAINISRAGYDAIEVVYKTGMMTVPTDLKTATLQLAMDNYNRKDGKDANITSASVGGYSVTYGTQATTAQAQANATAGTQSAMTDYMAIFNFYRIRSL